jgi:hypothetical protein
MFNQLWDEPTRIDSAGVIWEEGSLESGADGLPAGEPVAERWCQPGPVGIMLGSLGGISSSGVPLVICLSLGRTELIPARSIVTLRSQDVGREVVLAFEAGDARKPIVIGLLERPGSGPVDQSPQSHAPVPEPKTAAVEVDGEKLVISAEREIVLRCGEASLTLTRAGKILIRGTYLLSRSSGVNSIKGGSVQIN